MKSKDEPRPTFEEFVAQCHASFNFMAEFGFAEAPLPSREFINEFQVRFTNGTLSFVIEGINWGENTEAYWEDAAGTKASLFLFVPREDRQADAHRRAGESAQCFQIRIAAEHVREHCIDLLKGDTARFHDRATYWKRVTGKDRSYQKRILP
jgi:hypothetical protein